MPKLRFDYVEIKATRTDEGYLIDSPIVARTGILIYRNDDGSIRKELRRPEEVFSEDSLNSYYAKPITVDHPKSKVNSKNVSSLKVGTMLSKGRKDGENVRTDIVIHNPDNIGDKRELSVGYDIDLDETPGVYNGERYDAEQKNIRVNHLSVVKKARAGEQARLNMDSDEEPLNQLELVEMPKIRLDNGIEYEALPEVAVAMEKLRTDANGNVAVIQQKDSQIATLMGERDTLKARVDGIPAELETATKKARTDAEAAITARTALEQTAKTFKIDSKDKSDVEIKHAVIKTFNKDFEPSGKSSEYVQAAYDIAVSSRVDESMNSQRQTGAPVQNNRTDAADKNDAYTVYRNRIGSNNIPAKV